MRAVLWDMDDTLLETLPARMRALAHAYEVCLGRTVDPLAAWKEHRGGTLEALGTRLLGDEGHRFDSAYRDYYYANDRSPVPYPGVVEALESLSEAGIPMGVVTSKIAYGAVDELEQAGILRYFGAVVCFDDTDTHKPDAAPVLEALTRLGIAETADVALAGDSPADMQAAHNAGCLAVAALWGTIDRDELLALEPHHVARVPGQVADLARAVGQR